MLVREVMTTQPYSLSAEASIGEAVALMAERGFRHVPVLEGGEIVGMLSDRDLRPFTAASLSDSGRPHERLRDPVSKLMSGDVLTIEEEDDIDRAIEIFLEQKVGALPVIAPEGELVGIVSTHDVLRAAYGKL